MLKSDKQIRDKKYLLHSYKFKINKRSLKIKTVF